MLNKLVKESCCKVRFALKHVILMLQCFCTEHVLGDDICYKMVNKWKILVFQSKNQVYQSDRFNNTEKQVFPSDKPSFSIEKPIFSNYWTLHFNKSVFSKDKVFHLVIKKLGFFN